MSAPTEEGIDVVSFQRGSHSEAHDKSVVIHIAKDDKKKSAIMASNEDKKATEKDPKAPAPTVPWTALMRYCTPSDVVLMIIGSLFAIGNGLALPLFSVSFGDLLNDFNPPSDPSAPAPTFDIESKIARISMIFALLGAGQFVCSVISLGIWMRLSEKVAKKLREEYLKSLMRQEVAFFDENTPGELTSRLANDSELVKKALGEKVSTGFQHFSTFLAGIIIGFIYGWQLALIVIGVTPLLGAAGASLAKALGESSKNNQEAYAKAGSVADESFSNIKTVAALCAEEKEVNRYVAHLDAAKQAGIKKSVLQGASIGVTMFIMFCAYGLSLWFGTWLIQHETTNAYHDRPWKGGDVMTVFFALLMGAFSLGSLGPSFEAVASGKAAGYRLFSIIDREPQIDSLSKEGKKLDKLVGTIEFKGVHFHYPSRPESQILKGLSLKINPGQTVALVGESGSGKSTVFALLERFYNPTQGQVLIDGVDIKDLNIEWWRRHVGLVSQEPILFDVSIKENIRQGKPNATDEEIIKAAKLANADSFITQIPAKYEARCGPGGALLSGGQKQRIAIARALLKNPHILLLDEATSALDNESERLVQAALEKLMEGRTTLVIAHRLSTIVNSDCIYVMAEGQLKETGNHDELLRQDGLYAALVRAQGMKAMTGDDEKQPIAAADEGDVKEKKLSFRRQVSDKEVKKEKKDEEEDDKTPKEEIPVVPASRVWSMTRPDWGWVLVGIIGAAVVGAANPVWSIFFAEIVSVMYETDKDKQDDGARLWGLLFVALGAATALGNIALEFGFGLTGENLTKALRHLSFQSILRQDAAWFDLKQNNPRILTTRLVTEAALVHEGTTKRAGQMVQMLVALGAGLVIAFVNSPKLAAVTLATLPALVLASILQWQFIIGFSKQEKKAYEHASTVSGDAVGNIRTIQSYCVQEKVMNDYSDALDEPVRVGTKTALVSGISLGYSNFVIFGIHALCWWYGAKLIQEENLEFKKMLNAVFAIVMAGFGVGQAAQMVPNLSAAQKAKDVVFNMIDRKPKIDSSSQEGKKDKIGHGEITIRSGKFAYPTYPDRLILKGINIDIHPGESVALAGPSGGGKSTIIQLLLRQYDLDEGEISIDGMNIKDMHIKTYRSQIGLVSQEPCLFDASIRDNILYGRPDATMEDIEAACKAANIHEWIISQPEGYNTQVGVRGGQLSGGQKQRIAIARALVRRPKILLLDEATSALDTESEKVVQEALDKLLARKAWTTIVIAHRLSTIQNCDKIVVLDQGRVAEVGNHQELLKINGVYANLVKAGLKSGSSLPASS